MNENFRRCYLEFSQGKISARDFRSCLKGARYTDEDLVEALSDCIALQDWKKATVVIWLMQETPSRLFTPLLCELLERREDDDYLEAIADALIDIRDENSVASILKSLNYYIHGDPDCHFNRKLLAALSKIGTPVALQGIKQALDSEEEIIRREAQRLLQYIESNT